MWKNNNKEKTTMQPNQWLPSSNDTRVVLAAALNEFLRDSDVEALPSDLPASTPSKGLPSSVKAFAILEISGVTHAQARSIHAAFLSPIRAADWPPWQDYEYPTPPPAAILVATRRGESARRIHFPILFGEKCDIDAVLAHARGPRHQSYYQGLGLSASQMVVKTYGYNETQGWSIRQNAEPGAAAAGGA
jgi:hypothetical protein